MQQMTHPALSFGEMKVYGELAIGPRPDELPGLEEELRAALEAGIPSSSEAFPPFATVTVFLAGNHIGHMSKIQFLHGDVHYEFCSCSGKTKFTCKDREGLLHHLEEALGLTSPTPTPPDANT